jgi:hypothetical protein
MNTEPNIERRKLVTYMETKGPDREGIRDRLIDWAARASSFHIFGPGDTPLDQIGASGADDDSMDWLRSFERWVRASLDLSGDELDEIAARQNGMTRREFDELDRADADELPVRVAIS